MSIKANRPNELTLSFVEISYIYLVFAANKISHICTWPTKVHFSSISIVRAWLGKNSNRLGQGLDMVGVWLGHG